MQQKSYKHMDLLINVCCLTLKSQQENEEPENENQYYRKGGSNISRKKP